MPNEIESYTPFYKGKPLYGLGGGGGGSSTDENVMQTPTDNSNNDYEVLMSYSADNTERTEGARKTQHIKFNPFTKLLKLTGHLYDKWGLQTSRTMFEEDFEQLTQAEKDNGTNYYIPDREPLKICDYIYPVGAIYMSVNNISPAILFGGTWERIKDRFLLAAGDIYTVGSMDGEAEHTLSAIEMPAHGHNIRVWNTASAAGVWKYWTQNGTVLENNPYGLRGAFNASWATGNQSAAQNGAGDQAGRSDPSGGGQPHNNMPPYLTVNVWVRVPDPVQQEEEEGE